MGRERSAFHSGPEDRPPTKAEYIRVDHIVISFFACNRAADHTFRFADDPEGKRQIPFLDHHSVWANPCPLAGMGRHQNCAEATSLAARIPDCAAPSRVPG